MTIATVPLSVRARPGVAPVLTAAAVVWLLDGLFATGLCLSLNPTCTVSRTWQGVAGALVGRPAALAGGAAMVALGLALHFVVALAWAALYGALVARWRGLARIAASPGRAVAVGVAWGAVVWCTMSLVVVPLTRNTPPPFGTRIWWILLVGHLVVVGPPIVLLQRRRRD